MKGIYLLVQEPNLRKLDELVRRGYYPNRAEAIRTAIRDLLRSEGSYIGGNSGANLHRDKNP